MARDYAKRPHKKRTTRRAAGNKRRSSSIRPLTWLLTGLLTGLVVGAIAYFKISVQPQTLSAPPTQAKKKIEAAPVVEAKPVPTGPKFDFYTLLPEMEVAVPEKPAAIASNPARPNEEIKLPTPFEQAKYRLQLASFKRYDDADNLKAKLAMSGHVVEIHSIKLDNGSTWYRVYTPILSSREQAVNLQKELQNQAISSMLLKATEG